MLHRCIALRCATGGRFETDVPTHMRTLLLRSIFVLPTVGQTLIDGHARLDIEASRG